MRTNPSRHAAADCLTDVSGVAELLGVSERFVRRLVDERRIPFFKVGKFIRFSPDELRTWIDLRHVDPLR